MTFAIDSSGLQSVSLTTYAKVLELINPASGVVESGIQTSIEAMISDISADITTYLGFHTLLAERTEVYELRRGKRILTLDARPITVVPDSIKVATHESYLASESAIAVTDFTVRRAAGWIQFSRRMGTEAMFAELTYTGGLGVDADAVVTAHPAIAYAAALQCAYKWKRADSLGGNITTLAGANTQYNGQYRLLGDVVRMLSSHRRIPF